MSDVITEVDRLLTLHLGNIKVGIAQRMAASGRMASGRSVASLVVDVKDSEGVLSGGKQWETMQRGRGPGKVPSNFREIIKNWVIAKGINVQPRKGQSQRQAIESFSYLVTRNIMQKGTKLYRDKGYNDIYDSLLEEEIKKLSAETLAVMEIEIDKINDSYAYGDKDDK